MTIDIWNEWNNSGGPKYPHEKVIQFVFRNYPLPISENEGRRIDVLDLGCGNGVHTHFWPVKDVMLLLQIYPRTVSHAPETVLIDRYITTYEGGSYEQNDWLVTLER